MRKLLLIAMAAAMGPQIRAQDPKQIVRQSIANHRHDYVEAALHYTYLERDEEVNDGHSKVSISQVMPIHGVPYNRTLSRNGKMSAEEEQKEQEKLQKRENESSAEQAKQRHDYEHSIDFFEQVPDAFRFKMLPSETLNGRLNYLIELDPNPDFHPSNTRASMFEHIQAKLWIDKQDLQWTRAIARVIDTISIGWILARIGPPGTMTFEQTRLNDRDWLTSLIDVNASAHVMLVYTRPIHEHLTYYDFKPIAPQSAVTITQKNAK